MRKKLLFLLCFLFILTGCRSAAPDREPLTKSLFAMDTVMEFSVFTDDDRLPDEAARLITELEHSLSTTDPDSEIYKLNHTGSAVLSDGAAALLERSLTFCEKTGGALDLSVYPVVRAWGFTTGDYGVPDRDRLEALLQQVDYTKIDFDPDAGAVRLPADMEIDLGSVAKGWTGDQLLQLFRDRGVTSALLNLGGNVQVLGSKPDGSPWRVGIQDPLGESYLGVLSISDQAVITSGGYERFFEGEDGTVYWHIIDPDTGFPAKNGLISATAVGPEGVYCDALSTALFIMGPEKAAAFWRACGDFDMILVTEDREVLITEDLADDFQLADDLPYTLTVIPYA